jgi:hypothetical protein
MANYKRIKSNINKCINNIDGYLRLVNYGVSDVNVSFNIRPLKMNHRSYMRE